MPLETCPSAVGWDDSGAISAEVGFFSIEGVSTTTVEEDGAIVLDFGGGLSVGEG